MSKDHSIRTVRASGWLTLALLLSTSACTADDDGDQQDSDDAGTATDTATTAATTSATGSGEGGSSTGEPEHVDSFSCGLPMTCDPIVAHIDPEPVEAVVCATRLAVDGGAGVVSFLDTPGPDIDETQTLTIFRGDGTAIRQTRHRSCNAGDPGCEFDTLPWEPPGAHEACQVSVDPQVVEACGCDPKMQMCTNPCATTSWVTNCSAIDDLSCDELVAAAGG